MKNFVNFIKRSIENQNLFLVLMLLSLFFGLIPALNVSFSQENLNVLNKAQLVLASMLFPLLWILLVHTYDLMKNKILFIIFALIIFLIAFMMSFMVRDNNKEAFLIYLIPLLIFTAFAIPYSIIINKKELKEIQRVKAIAKRKEEETKLARREAAKKEKAKLKLIYASFLLNCGVVLDSAQVVELNMALKDILEVDEETDSDSVSFILHRISKSIPPSLQPLVAAVIAEKWIELKNREGEKKYEIEDLYSSAINK